MHTSLLNPDKWVALYADALYSYAIPRVNDSNLAEDLVQETFLSAWKAKDSFKGEASEKSWLYSILKNKIIDHYRKKSRDIMQPLSSQDSSDTFFDEADHWTGEDAPCDWGVDFQQLLDYKDFYKVFEACKNKLQNIQQSVFVMKYMEELDSATICKALGLSSSNYWVLIHRSKLQLRNCLEKNWLQLK